MSKTMSVLRAALIVAVSCTATRALAATPSATTTPATMITTTSAVLNGAGNPTAEATTGWFRLSPTNPVTCNDTFGTRVPSSSGTDLGSGSVSVPYSITTTGLTSGVTYYFCAIVANASGTSFGAVLSFTIPGPPVVLTTGAAGVATTSATLQGSANPVAATTTGWFRYGTVDPGACNDTFGTRAPAAGGSALGGGTASVDYTRGVTGLLPGTSYYYCAIANNAYGTSFGVVVSFTTPGGPPVVSTGGATATTSTSATLNASANPTGASTVGWFRYSTVSPGACNDSFGTRAPVISGTALGAGNSSVPFNEPLGGLSPLTTYYYCAIATNFYGTTFGALASFTTPAPPTAVTSAATLVTNASATLNGSSNPNRAATTGHYRYSTTDPGACNDTFGSRAPVAGGSPLGSGSASVAFAQSITGLSPGTTYYYCAIATNAEGMAFGAVLSFTTLASPAVITAAATLVTSSTATLNGTADPNGAIATGWYRYATVDPGACNNTFGTITATTALGAGTAPVAYPRAIAGLTPATTYYFCAIANNTYGTSYGAVLSFTTPAAAPTVTTNSATLLTGTTAQLNGSANPGGDTTNGWYRYSTVSPGSCNDSFGTRAPVAGGTALGSGTTSVAFPQAITGLTPGTTYYFCAIASNGVGTGLGALVTFVTPAAPTVITSAPTLVTSSSATLNGSADPNGASATGYYRYSTVDPGSCDDTFGSRAPAAGGSALGSGSSSVAFAQSISGLSAGVVYYYCAIATNAEGIAFGTVMSFTTLASPTVITAAATLVTSSTATLNGTADPNGAIATGWYRYATVDPGVCNNTFGTITATTALGAGIAPVSYPRAIAGLTPATTYYFCAIANNTYGTSYGAVLSFTTPSTVPTVTTNSATLLTGTTAQLNGSANPGGDAATGWYRYGTASPGSCNDSFGTRAPVAGGTALGSGTTSVAYSVGITGLSPGTTYYVCAIASNSGGTGLGALVTFVTPAAPTVITSAPTLVTSSSATLNGSADPNGASATGYYRYSSIDPGSCDDTFGSRAPAAGGSALGSGSASVAFAQSISGLSPGVVYYYCAIATNAEGIAFGTVMSFTTLASPTVITAAATLVTSSTATLNGTADPNGAIATGWYRYATVDPGACNNTFGTITATTALGAGTTPVAYTRAIAGLTPATTYYFCAIANNTYGTSYGAVLSFTTPSTVPTVTTNSATLLTGSTAQLNGSANPGGDATNGWYRYSTVSPGSCNDSFGTRAPVAGGTALGSGTTSVAYSESITGLSPGTTYYVCAIASNSGGTGLGALVTFVTPAAPTVITSAPTLVTSSSATLNGSGNPNRAATTGYYRYSTTDPGACNDTFGSRAPAAGGSALGSGSASVAFAQSISGLSSGVVYYYCAIATNAEGIAFGTVMSFTTLASPTVITSPATLVTSSTATLNGTADPNGAIATGWYRYATVDPGACNNTFGTITATTALGAGTTPVAYTRAIAGLTPATTYYFCAIANNTYGTSYGAVLSFTTPSTVPTVTTNSATLLTGSTAQLNGSANPGGDATNGWYRYSTVSPGSCNDSFGTRAPVAGGTSLGSGTTSVAFPQAIGGLTPSTTYYFCAIASNSGGTGLGALVTFTTPAAPTAVTSPATLIAATTATLNGSGNPNRAATTGHFRYSTIDPGSCDDTFGSRAPAAGGSALGSGSASITFAQPISGLSPGVVYYYCAITSNAEGVAFGAVLSFTTLASPTVVSAAATLVTATTATLNGSADPNGATAIGWYRYATTHPGVCNDAFGTRAPALAGTGTALGAGTAAVNYAQSVGGLTPGATYYYCAIASNAYGTSFGAVLSFTALAGAPSVTTAAATGVTTTTATLNGSANPNGASTSAWFRIDTVTPAVCNDTFGTRVPAAAGAALGAGNSAVAFSDTAPGIAPGTTYYYCAIATNSVGMSFGTVRSFTTPAPPTVSTFAATPVTATSATLNAQADPNGYATTGWFRYSSTSPGACNDTFGTRAPASGGTGLGAGTVFVAFSQALTGLTPATTYYFCAIGSSSIGTTLGEILSFTTPNTQPSVTTLAASGIAPTAATLEGSANPNGDAASGWFRYSLTNPGVCSDTFGTRAPAAGGTALGSGNSAVAFSAPISGLTTGLTYYFCAIASNGIGVGAGTVRSFTTSAAPTATTVAATGVASTGGTLNGSANPNLTATTGWYRYSATDPGSCNDTFGTRAPAAGGTALGAGSSAVGYTQTLAGLTPETTYYFCAIASSAVGTGFGAVLSFTTTAPPAVTTDGASAVSSTGATLDGSADPNLASATGWFRYATASPGVCNDAFGTRAPAAGGTALGSGSSPVAYSRALTGLASGTTYYYCAIASNAAGTSFGAVLSFTTAGAPSVTTDVATAVSNTTATLNGSANPNLTASTGWFRYSATSPGACNDAFGTRTPAAGGTALGAGGSTVPFSQALTGLTSGATYYYCAIASNAAGTRFGAVLSFTTLAAPTVTTSAATAISSTGATLNGSADPNLLDSAGWFRFSTANPGSCDDAFGTRVGSAALGAGAAAVPYSEPVTGLAPGTTYYFCAIAASAVGTGFGAVLSFTTPSSPAVTTTAATAVSSAGATLNGSANPNGAATTGWLRYGATDPGSCNDTFGTRAPAAGGTALGGGSSAVAYSEVLVGLTPATTYYFCAIASNAAGTSFGAVLSFTTPAVPSVTTDVVSVVTSTGATLNGSANPNGATATGWFRYATTTPGACNDTFGTRAPAVGGSALGGGSSAVVYSRAVIGLTAGTTYYYCAIASNSLGAGFGTVMSFTTPAVPTVTTEAATAISATGATLNASADPNNSDTTGWFRYDTTSPASCNDSFGTRAPAAGGTALGAGASPVAFSQAITGLAPGATYYYCALASNAAGTTVGAVLSFTTAASPSVTTETATTVSSGAATLNASANPNLTDSTGWFRFATTDPGTCDDTFGTRAPATGGSPLGAGSSPVPYTYSLGALTPGTTYYYCAIASNSVGVAFGTVLSFTTTARPSVTTEAATAVASAGATLNGTASPNGDASTGWFRFSGTAPGACDDTFGTRAPATGGTALGAGSSPAPFSEALTGLLSSTTYYYCAIASNAVGTTFGSVMSFTTPAAPTAPVVTTDPASDVMRTTATLNGSATPSGTDATGWFRYGATDPGACDDTFGTRAPAADGTALGAGSTAIAFAEAVIDLAPATTYYYCAIASNGAGTSFGELLTFTTTAAPPTVVTTAPTDVMDDSAVLNGSAIANGEATTGWFRYGTTAPAACDDAFGVRAPATGGLTVGTGSTAVAISEMITGLTRGTVYYYCAIAENAQGIAFGEVVSFAPGTAPPTVTTEAASAVDGTSATIAGTANPNGTDTTGWFRYGDVAPGVCDDAYGTRAPAMGGAALGAGTVAAPFDAPLTGLEPNLTYYYCAAASNLGGAVFGEVLTFTTDRLPPVVTTVAPTLGMAGDVTLNGRANPRGSETTGWFRYDSTAPAACDDTFGTRWPAIDGTFVGTGRTAATYSELATGLAPGTYYVCAIASNAAGTAFGDVLTFEVTADIGPVAPRDGGCGCRVGSRSSGGPLLALALLLLVAVRRRRRRA